MGVRQSWQVGFVYDHNDRDGFLEGQPWIKKFSYDSSYTPRTPAPLLDRLSLAAATSDPRLEQAPPRPGTLRTPTPGPSAAVSRMVS
jgi:hypothetical protein